MSYVKLPEDFDKATVEACNAAVQKTGFFFDIPESITIPSYETHLENQLPPSCAFSKWNPPPSNVLSTARTLLLALAMWPIILKLVFSKEEKSYVKRVERYL